MTKMYVGIADTCVVVKFKAKPESAEPSMSGGVKDSEAIAEGLGMVKKITT